MACVVPAKFLSLLLAVLADQDGATAVEYGLLVGLIAAVMVVGLGLFGSNMSSLFSGISFHAP